MAGLTQRIYLHCGALIYYRQCFGHAQCLSAAHIPLQKKPVRQCIHVGGLPAKAQQFKSHWLIIMASEGPGKLRVAPMRKGDYSVHILLDEGRGFVPLKEG